MSRSDWIDRPKLGYWYAVVYYLVRTCWACGAVEVGGAPLIWTPLGALVLISVVIPCTCKYCLGPRIIIIEGSLFQNALIRGVPLCNSYLCFLAPPTIF